jgi:hypothetical protein
VNRAYLVGIVGMLFGLTVLGVIAIDQAYKINKEREFSPPYHRVPELTIEIEKDALLFHEGSEFIVLKQGHSIRIPLAIESHIERRLDLELSITSGPGNAPHILPDGVRPTFDQTHLELMPHDRILSEITLQADENAPDGTYLMTLLALGKETGMGTGFTLVVGEGSTFLIGPDGPIGPVQNFTKTETSRGDIRAVLTINEIALNEKENVNVTVSLINTGLKTRVLGYDWTVIALTIQKEYPVKVTPNNTYMEWRDMIWKNDFDSYLRNNHTYVLEPNKPVSMNLLWDMKLPAATVCHEDNTCEFVEPDILENGNKFRTFAIIYGRVTPSDEIYEGVTDGRDVTAGYFSQTGPAFIVTHPIEFRIFR